MAENLFNKPSNGTIVVHDVNGDTQEVLIKKLRFRLTAYGILKNKNSILFQWNPIVQKYNLPGGAVELGERIEDALMREFNEETGISIKLSKSIGIKEDFFVFREEYAHSILVFYEVEKLAGGLDMAIKTGDSDGAEFIKFDKIDLESFTSPFKEVLRNVILFSKISN